MNELAYRTTTPRLCTPTGSGWLAMAPGLNVGVCGMLGFTLFTPTYDE